MYDGERERERERETAHQEDSIVQPASHQHQQHQCCKYSSLLRFIQTFWWWPLFFDWSFLFEKKNPGPIHIVSLVQRHSAMTSENPMVTRGKFLPLNSTAHKVKEGAHADLQANLRSLALPKKFAQSEVLCVMVLYIHICLDAICLSLGSPVETYL